MNNYEIEKPGILKQIAINPIDYNEDYVKQKANFFETPYLRFGYMLPYIQEELKTTKKGILEIGYGNGKFLEIAKSFLGDIVEVAGHDISGCPVPEGVKFYHDLDKALKKDWLMVCLFDVLEHFPNPHEFLEKASKTVKYLYITVPNSNHSSFENDSDFFKFMEGEYAHLKPNEHLWHFDRDGLTSLLMQFGFTHIQETFSLEDVTRKRQYQSFKESDPRQKLFGLGSNTITGLFVNTEI